MKEEQDILRKIGTKNPFHVPEGYFENFTQELMSKLPEKDSYIPESEINLWTRIKPWIYMAAMFVGTIFIVQGLVSVQKHYFPTDNIAAAEEIYTDEEDCFMSSSLYNEYVLYSYLTTYEND